jgi:hypothetical protein
MPVHDWTRVEAGIFHDFHHSWIEESKRAINRRLQGTDYYALAEQVTGGFGPDVLTLQRPLNGPKPAARGGKRRGAGVALADAPPKTRFRITNPPLWYAAKRKSVTIRHVSEHRVVAVLEIMSPGNKAGRGALNAFVRKAQDLITAGIHLGIVDVFPPTPRDPEGIHPLVWDVEDSEFQFDPDKPLTCASYIGRPGVEAFVEPFAVGDELPAIPLFLTADDYLNVPLEASYQAAFEAVPDVWREVLVTKSSRRS